MEDLAKLKSAVDVSWHEFIAALPAFGFANEWEFYKASEKGGTFPALDALFAAHLAHLHAFYFARDGAGGVLGSRGL